MNKVIPGLRVVLGGLFLWAGLAKASASSQFALALVPFTFVPSAWLGVLGLLLPVVEIAAGILILMPRTQRLGALVILALSLIFIVALGWALNNNIIVSCACFGKDETPSAEKMMVAMARDVLIAAGAAVVLFRPRARTPDSDQRTPGSG